MRRQMNYNEFIETIKSDFELDLSAIQKTRLDKIFAENIMTKCVICGDVIEQSRTNNSDPYCKGECCDYCNREVVLPLRIKLIQNTT